MGHVHKLERDDGLHLIVPPHQEGERPAPRLNVVFVHGLGGGGYTTWCSGAESELDFWPQKLAAQHEACSVWTLNYRTKIYEWRFSSRSRMDLLDRAAWFIEELLSRGIANRPIVFVAHSLGGLLVKQALQFANSMGRPKWHDVSKQTRAVAFIASPHDGSRLADFALNVAEISKIALVPRWLFRPSPILHCLRNSWSTLRYLGDWYRDYALAEGIRTLAFSEGREYRGVIVVDESSANPGIIGLTPVPLDEDHVSIAKPKLATSLVYAKISELLSDLTTVSGAQSAQSDIVESICGDWWARVITPRHESALACVRIEKHSQTGDALLEGRSFDLNGGLVAKWNSRFSKVERSKQTNRIDFNYVYEGERFDEPGKRLLHGHAEINFEEPGDPREKTQVASGKFVSIYPPNEFQKEPELYGTARMRMQYMRRAVQESDVATLRTGVNKEKCKLVVRRILSDVWEIPPDDQAH